MLAASPLGTIPKIIWTFGKNVWPRSKILLNALFLKTDSVGMSSPKNFDDTYLENLWFFPFKTVSFALWVNLLSCVKFSCILQQFIKRAVKVLMRYWTRSNADFTPKWFGVCLMVRFQYQERFDDISILQVILEFPIKLPTIWQLNGILKLFKFTTDRTMPVSWSNNSTTTLGGFRLRFSGSSLISMFIKINVWSQVGQGVLLIMFVIWLWLPKATLA